MSRFPEGYINPKRARALAAFMAALPGTQKQIGERSGVCKKTIIDAVESLHGTAIHIGDWLPHPRGGPPSPIWMVGGGEDVPDTLRRKTRKEISLRYEKRVRRAIAKAKAGGKEDGRYLRHISLHKANETAKRTLAEPQGPWAALFGVRAGSMNAEG